MPTGAKLGVGGAPLAGQDLRPTNSVYPRGERLIRSVFTRRERMRGFQAKDPIVQHGSHSISRCCVSMPIFKNRSLNVPRNNIELENAEFISIRKIILFKVSPLICLCVVSRTFSCSGGTASEQRGLSSGYDSETTSSPVASAQRRSILYLRSVQRWRWSVILWACLQIDRLWSVYTQFLDQTRCTSSTRYVRTSMASSISHPHSSSSRIYCTGRSILETSSTRKIEFSFISLPSITDDSLEWLGRWISKSSSSIRTNRYFETIHRSRYTCSAFLGCVGWQWKLVRRSAKFRRPLLSFG